MLSVRSVAEPSLVSVATLGTAAFHYFVCTLRDSFDSGWIFAPGTALLIVGGFLMQFMVQGAWGVIPVHLNEYSRRTFAELFPAPPISLGISHRLCRATTAWLPEHFRDANGNANMR